MSEATPVRVTPADDAARLEQIGAELGQVDTALRRLDDESYGTCEVCGLRLDAAALEAAPLTTRCAQHRP
jgi:DnaK suppressor protein